MTPDTYDHITFNNWSYVSGVIRLGCQPSRMTPDTYDHFTYTSGRMYQVSYDVAASRHVCHLIHTTTTLRSFRRTHADAALVAHLWVHSGQQHCQKHNAVQGMRCIPSCSRQTPTIRTAIRPHTYDDAHPTFALVERIRCHTARLQA